MSQYDLIVIGSGPAGARGAEQAARLGKKVALVERAPRLGGAGIATGTVPSKTLREMAQTLAALRQRNVYGLEIQLPPELSLGDLMYRRPMVLEAEWGLIQRNVDRYHIEVVRGEASLRDAYTVRVRSADGRTADLTATAILIATGSRPRRPAQIPADARIYDSDTLPEMGRLPRSLVVVGGGVVGSEYAAMFAALGTAVTLVETSGRLLPPVDGELAARFQRHLEGQGVRVLLNEPVVAAHTPPEALRFELQSGEVLEAEAALVAVGRTGNTRGLGLAAAGVQVDDQDYIPVNARLQTSAASVYAAGDVATRHCFAPIAMQQGLQAAQNAVGGGDAPGPGLIPLAVYTIPEIALVGLTEEQCRAQGLAYLVGRAYADQNPRGQITGDTSGLLKLIFSPADGRVLGVHLLSEQASELIHLGLHAMASGGTLAAFTQMVYNYPTLSALYSQAALNGLEVWERWRQAQAGPAEA